MSTWNAIVVGGSLTVQVGDSGAIQTNPDPTAYNNVWTSRVSGTTENLYGIAWNTQYFVAVGANGAAVRSYDGIGWGPTYPPVTVDLNDIATGGNVFIAVGLGGTIVGSQDSSGWVILPSGTTENLWGVTIANAQWMTVGDNNTIVTGPILSTDHVIDWMEIVNLGDETISTGRFNYAVDAPLTFAGAYTRLIYGPSYKDQFLAENEGFSDTVDSGDGLGSINYIAGSSSPVVSEEVVFPNDNSDEIGGSGSGIPSFVSLLERAVFYRLGDFSSWHTLSLTQETVGSYDRLFDAFEKVLQGLALTDSLAGSGFLKTISQALALSAATQAAGAYAEALLSTVGQTDAAAALGVFALVLPEKVSVKDANAHNATLNLSLVESIFSSARFVLNGETYTGWALDSAALAPTEYQGFDFNSMCTYKGINYAAKSDGIYTLKGSTDDGAAIAAAITLGQDDFGTSYEKKVERAYLGLRNDGSVVLKAILLDRASNQKTEYWYELTEISAIIRKERIKLPKGLKAHYWQFELANVQGADFELDTMEVYPLILTRRV